MRKKEVLAIIPARAGSKAIKNKNILDLGGFPLLSYSIASACMSTIINRVIVSTNSEEYAAISKTYGAEVPFLRPDDISQDTSLDTEFLYFTLKTLQETENYRPDIVALLRPTTPIRSPECIDEAIGLLERNDSCSAVVSVTLAEECPYKWMILDNGYLVSPFSELKPDDVGLPRQSFPKVLIPDGYIDVLRTDLILNKKLAYGDSAIPYYTPEITVDIDTFNDVNRVLNMDLEKTVVYQWLKKIKR